MKTQGQGWIDDGARGAIWDTGSPALALGAWRQHGPWNRDGWGTGTKDAIDRAVLAPIMTVVYEPGVRDRIRTGHGDPVREVYPRPYAASGTVGGLWWYGGR